MIKLGNIALGGIPKVAASVGDDLSARALPTLSKSGADIAELRIDRYSAFDPAHVLREVKKFGSFASIATIRSKKEGGAWNLSEAKRLALFRAVIPHVDAVDIELSSTRILSAVVSSAHRAKKIVIISSHDFTGTPSSGKLNRILLKAKSAGADIVKIAAMARTKKDLETMAGFTLSNAHQNIIAISMGAKGSLSRIFLPLLGSLLTYASLGSATAPGQMDCRKTRDLLAKLWPKQGSP